MIGRPTERHHLLLMRSHKWVPGEGRSHCFVCGVIFTEQVPLMWMVECPGPKFRLIYVGEQPVNPKEDQMTFDGEVIVPPLPDDDEEDYPEDPFDQEPYVAKVGDWARVWAQIKRTSDMAGVHPEDTLLTISSHNEDYDAHVSNDHVEFGPGKPDFARECFSLYQIVATVRILGTKAKTTALIRCDLHEGHIGVHRRLVNEQGAAYQWSSAQAWSEE